MNQHDNDENGNEHHHERRLSHQDATASTTTTNSNSIAGDASSSLPVQQQHHDDGSSSSSSSATNANMNSSICHGEERKEGVSGKEKLLQQQFDDNAEHNDAEDVADAITTTRATTNNIQCGNIMNDDIEKGHTLESLPTTTRGDDSSNTNAASLQHDNDICGGGKVNPNAAATQSQCASGLTDTTLAAAAAVASTHRESSNAKDVEGDAATTTDTNNDKINDNSNDKNTSNSNSSQRYTPRQGRRPPQRFVARPSKQGWSVDDGDRAFLEHDARYYNNLNPLSTSSSAAAAALAAASTTTSVLTDDSVLGSSAATSSSSAVAKIAAIPPPPAEAAVEAPWTCHKCTTSNDPSRLRCSACQGWKGKGGSSASSSASKVAAKSPARTTTSSSSVAVAAAAWTCHKCTTSNASSRLRCSACQGWKSGYREGYSSKPTSSSLSPSGVGVGGSSARSVAKGTATTSSSSGQSASNTDKKSKTSSSMPTKKVKVEDASLAIRSTHMTTSKRKSAISRRPRQLRPTEKMIAFMNDLEEEKVLKLSSLHHQQQQAQHQQRKRKAEVALGEDTTTPHANSKKSASTSSSSSWNCSRCCATNLSTKSRCSSCQAWRGGKREGLTSSGSSKQNSSLAVEKKKRKKTSASTASVAKAKAVGGGSVEQSGNEDDEESDSLEDVVCCLCKCAVDFSDKAFFLPPPSPTGEGTMINATTETIVDTTEGVRTMNAEGDSKEHPGKSKSPAEESASSSSVEDDNENGAIMNGGALEESEPTTKFELAEGNGEKQCKQMKVEVTTDGSSVNANDEQLYNDEEIDDDDDDESKPFFQLPYRFYDPTNALVLCDGPAYAKKNKRHEYKCERAFHQQCHFVPVLSIPRGPWRCLICKYHDEMYLKAKSSKNGSSEGSDDIRDVKLSSVELNSIFRCRPVCSRSSTSSSLKDEKGSDNNECARNDSPTMVTDGTGGLKDEIANVEEGQFAKQLFTQSSITPNDINTVQLEQRFEALSAPLKAHLLHTELTTRSRTVINSSLATIRTAEHSLRSITETSKARKALAERVENEELGLPQELCQSVMRIALCKTRIREMIFSLENVIRSRPPHYDVVNVPMLVDSKSSSEKEDDEKDDEKLDARNDGVRIDPIGDLMHWYLLQQGSPARNTTAPATGTAPVLPNAPTIIGELTKEDGKSLLHHLFPEGNLSNRRPEPRTGEAHIHNVEKHATVEGDGNSVTSISLDDLVCWTCHGTDASDENDMLLCDGIGCCRAFHMKCLEPKLSLDDVHKSDDDNWFCPLCMAHATLIHYAQCEYFGDDLEESPITPSKKTKNCGHHNGKVIEWETAKEVFAEAPFELRVAQKFKENIRDEETAKFLAEELGIVTHSYTSSLERGKPSEAEMNNLDIDSDDDGTDDDFEGEDEELFDDESLASEVDLERRLAKEKIGREELDALSNTSDLETDDDNSDSSSANVDDIKSANSSNNRPRRSRRRRFMLPGVSGDSMDDDDDDSSIVSAQARSSDIGTLDVANIVRGKRSRTIVDYRKLADAMFGDESDEDAEGPRKEYTYKPKQKKSRYNQDDSDDNDGSDDVSDEECDDTPKKENPNKKNVSSGKLEGRETRHVRAMNGKSAQTGARHKGTRNPRSKRER